MSFPDSDQEQVLLRDLVQSNELSNWVSILDDSFQPSDEQPYVLLIRDLHGDYEAQMNVSKIMEVITHRSKSKPLILVEGASGPVDTSFFSSFPDQKVRKTVTKEYVSEGWITGPEYFSIIQPEKNARYEIWGVEDQNLYIRNFRTFREVRSNSEGVASWFVNIEDVIQQLKQKIYHPQLLEWDKKITDRMTGRMDLELYLNDLFQIINVEPYPNLNHFRLFLEKKKSFDFKRLDAEKNRFIQELSDLLSQDDLSQLIQKSLEYRLGKMQTVAYLEYLALQATKTDKDLLKEYPIFEDAIALFKMQNDTDISILIREIESCESQILNSLLKTEEEKRLYQLCEDVEMIKKISILQLTRKDWGKIQESIMGDPVGNLLRSVEELSKRWSIELSENLTRQSPVLKEHLEEAKSFYEIALNRDQVIAEKAIEQIKKKGVKEAVLVTGGFHTDGIKEIFIEKGIQCQVATPRLTHIPSDEVYLSRMLDERFESHALALPSLFSHLIKSISPLLQIREWERLATAYIQAWIADVFQRSGVQDNPNSREAVRRGLKSWASARMVENGRLNEDEEQIMGLVEKRLVQASPVKSLEMTREQIEQYIRTDPVQGEVVLRYLIKFYPDRKADIEFAKSLYRKLYQPRIFSIVDRKSAVRAVSLPKDYDERIDRSADALLPYTEIITAVNILLIHENTSNIKKIVFRLDADRDEVHIEEDVMFINLKNPEGLKTIDVLKIFQRDLGWDFVPAIHKIETRYPYLLFGGNDFEAFNVVLPERMAGMGDLVFAANAAQVLKEAFPGKVVRAVFGQEEDYRRTAEAKLIDGMDPDRNRQEINGVEVVLLDGNDGIIGRQDAAVIYALGGTEKEVFNQRGTFERFGGPAKAKVLVHEFGFESLIQDPLDSGEGHIGFFKDEIGMAPVSPFSRDLYSQKYPRDDEKILEQRKRILKKLPGWERLNQILGQQDLERTVASEWGFVYAHQGYSIKAYFETFEKAREKDEKFANGDKTFFVTCGQNDRDAQEQVAQWAENYDYNLLVYNSDTKTLTPVRESKGSRVTVILDYSVPRKLFSELFLYSDDLPTMVTGQDNLANILYLNILSSGRPFFFEQLIFQDVTSIYALIREKLGEEAVMRFRALWGHSPSEKAEASRMFSSPREYRKFFKKIALALNEHNSFVPQIYYLVLRMIAKRNVLEPGARAQVLVEELQREGQSGEVKRDGYVRKGDKSWEKFKKERRTIQEYDLTENYQENLVRLIEKMMQDPRLDPQVQARLKEHLEKIKDPDFKVYGFSSIVKDSEDYLLDYYDQAKNELYLGTDVMDELKERGPPSLVEEYLVHSILCPILGHDQAIMIQQVLFPDHYPDKKKLSEQTQEHLYKGVLGKAFRSLIDWRASSAGQKIVDVLFKRIHERYDLRDDVTLREVIMRLGDRYQLTKRPSWAESVRKSVFLEDKFNEAQNRQIDQWMRLTPDDVAHHQIRTAILSNLMLQQYIETSGKDEKGFERDFVLLSLGSLLQDVSKGVDPIKSLTEKGRFLSREERAVIHDHGRQSVLILDQTHAWEKMRVGGLIQNQEEEEILKMLVLYHADLPGFKKAQGQLPSELQDRVWLLLSFLKIADSVDAANDRSRPYNMHRPVRTLDALYAEEKESRYAGLQATQERMSGDERALEAFHQIVIHAGERLRKMEELAAETEIYHELYKRLRQQSAIREETPKTWAETHVPLIADKRIAEVTMEMALSDEMLKRLRDEGLSDDEMRAVAMSNSTGGIGPLLKERVIAQSQLGANVVGFSLLYDQVWTQKIQPDGTLTQEKVEVGKFLRKVLEYEGEVKIKMYDGREVSVKVWKSPRGAYGKGTVYFFDVPEMTNVVYPGAKDAPEGKDLSRYKEDARRDQSWILGRGVLAWMKKIGQKVDLVVMSEAPTIFSHHRVFKDEYSEDPFFADTRYVFNDHTPLEYAHPYWNEDVLKLMRVDPRYYETMPVWTSGRQSVDVTGMIINASDGVYGVAEKHGRVMREMPMLRQFGDKITYVTNGVSAQYWPTDEFKSPSQIARMKDSDLLAVKNKRRERLIRWLAKRKGLGDAWAEKMLREGNPVGIWTRRIVEYKRLDRFASILDNDAMKEEFLKTGIVFVIGGRIHQDDDYGLKQYARIQAALARDPRLRERVIFLENYNIWEAPTLFQGADFSLMLADDTREASATGFQKAQMSGDLIIASHDGAIPESVSFYDGKNTDTANGFEVPFIGGKPTPEGLLSGFISFGNVFRNKPVLGKMVRNTLNQSGRVSVDRTAKDMLRLFSRYFSEFSAEEQMHQDEEAKADQTMMKMDVSPKEAKEVLDQLNRTLKVPFVWKYKEGGARETNLYISIPHLQGLIDGFNYIHSLGTVGEWSLNFHAYNQEGQGDVLTYINEITSVLPETHPIRQEISRLITEASAATTISEKIKMNALGIVFMDRILALLRDRAGNLITDESSSLTLSSGGERVQTETLVEPQYVQKAVSRSGGAAAGELRDREAAIPSATDSEKEPISYIGYGTMIPKKQFAPPGNEENENLVDLWYETLKEIAPDQPILIHARGSLTYLRSPDRIHWDIANDADFVLNLPQDIIKQADFYERFEKTFQRKAKEMGITVEVPLKEERKSARAEYYHQRKMNMTSRNGFKIPGHFVFVPFEMMDKTLIVSGGFNLEGAYYGNRRAERLVEQVGVQWSRLTRVEEDFRSLIGRMKIQLKELGGWTIKEGQENQFAAQAQKVYKRLILMAYMLGDEELHSRLLNQLGQYDQQGVFKKKEIVENIVRELKYFEGLSDDAIKKAIIVHYRLMGYNAKFDEFARELIERSEKQEDPGNVFWMIRHSSFGAQLVLEQRYGPVPWWVRGDQPKASEEMADIYRDREALREVYLVNTLIQQAVTGEAPEWMALDYKLRRGLKGILDEGDSSIEREINKLKKSIDRYSSDPAVRVKIGRVLDLLAVHPHASRLSALQFEGVGYRLMGIIAQNEQAYQEHKKQMDEKVRELYPEIRNRIMSIEDRREALRTAMIYAGVMNLLDLTHAEDLQNVAREVGLDINFEKAEVSSKDLQTLIDAVVERVKAGNLVVDDLSQFQSLLDQKPGGMVLYFLDNHGEVILDQLVMEQLLINGYSVVAVARSVPVQDDVTVDEARLIFKGNPELRKYWDQSRLIVLTDGSYLLGANLKEASQYPDFLSAWQESVAYIAKGGGNFQSLYGQRLSIPGLHVRMMKNSPQAYHALKEEGRLSGEQKSPFDMIMVFQPANPVFLAGIAQKQSEYHPVVQKIVRGEYTGKRALVMLKDKMDELSYKDKQKIFAYYLSVPEEGEEKALFMEQYQFEDIAGIGLQGIVFQVRDVRTQQMIAIKVSYGHPEMESVQLGQLLSYQQKNGSHKHVLSIVKVGVVMSGDGFEHAYLVSEFLPIRELLDQVPKSDLTDYPYTSEAHLRSAVQVMEGLVYLMRDGILLRDPQIALTGNEENLRTVLIDLGLMDQVENLKDLLEKGINRLRLRSFQGSWIRTVLLLMEIALTKWEAEGKRISNEQLQGIERQLDEMVRGMNSEEKRIMNPLIRMVSATLYFLREDYEKAYTEIKNFEDDPSFDERKLNAFPSYRMMRDKIISEKEVPEQLAREVLDRLKQESLDGLSPAEYIRKIGEKIREISEELYKNSRIRGKVILAVLGEIPVIAGEGKGDRLGVFNQVGEVLRQAGIPQAVIDVLSKIHGSAVFFMVLDRLAREYRLYQDEPLRELFLEVYIKEYVSASLSQEQRMALEDKISAQKREKYQRLFNRPFNIEDVIYQHVREKLYGIEEGKMEDVFGPRLADLVDGWEEPFWKEDYDGLFLEPWTDEAVSRIGQIAIALRNASSLNPVENEMALENELLLRLLEPVKKEDSPAEDSLRVVDRAA